MTEYQTLIYRKDGPIGWVTLNRPDALNAYNLAMRDELYEVLGALRDDPDVRGAVLSGAGERAFCAGADLTEFGTAPSQAIARQVRWERDVWGLFLSLEKPLVAALHGYVFGSGLEMALLCDFRIAAEDAVFSLPETSLGLIPAAGATQTLPRTIGPAAALDVLLIGRRVGATEAHDMGLVNSVVSRARLLAEAQDVMETVLDSGQAALQAAKVAVNRGMDMPIGEALAMETRLAASLAHGVRGVVPAWSPYA